MKVWTGICLGQVGGPKSQLAGDTDDVHRLPVAVEILLAEGQLARVQVLFTGLPGQRGASLHIGNGVRGHGLGLPRGGADGEEGRRHL